MREHGSIILILLILTAAAVGAFQWVDALQYSLFTYRSPLSVVEITPGTPMSAQTERVVVVFVGGLGYAALRSLDMPNLETLLEAGASAPMISHPPTYPLPAWTTLLTGTWPDLNNAPVMEVEDTTLRPIGSDHLLAAAQEAGLRTAIAGFERWRTLLPSDTVDASFYTTRQDAVADAQVAQAAFDFIADSQFNLVLVYFSQVDAVGRAAGARSAEYAGAARQVDNHLQQIVRLVDMSSSVLIVTSDHGLTDDGRLGGGESELTQFPFVMIGQHIIPGAYSQVRQIDVAPTLAALLGTRLPSAAEGRPLFEMLQLDQETLTSGQLTLAAQKVALGDAYLMVMGEEGLSQATHQDLSNARQALLNGNQAGASELAKWVAEEGGAEMASAKAARIATERLPRLGAAALGLLLSLLFLWGRRGPNSLVGIIGAAVTIAVYYALYRLGGYTFSLSTLGAPNEFVTTLIRYAVIGMVGGGLFVLVGLLYRDERSWVAAVTASYDYGLFAIFLSALPVLVGYWHHGATVRWYLPDLGFTLLHFVALVQVGVVALMAIPLPWLVALVAWGLGRWRTHSETRVQVWDPVARLRRR